MLRALTPTFSYDSSNCNWNLTICVGDEQWEDYDVILGDKIHLTNIKWIKVLKYGKLSFLRNPSIIFKKKRNIRFQFDMFHGNGYLDKAIDLLPDSEREEFKNFTINNQFKQNFDELK